MVYSGMAEDSKEARMSGKGGWGNESISRDSCCQQYQAVLINLRRKGMYWRDVGKSTTDRKVGEPALESRQEPRETWQQENMARVTPQEGAAGVLPGVPAGPRVSCRLHWA